MAQCFLYLNRKLFYTINIKSIKNYMDFYNLSCLLNYDKFTIVGRIEREKILKGNIKEKEKFKKSIFNIFFLATFNKNIYH